MPSSTASSDALRADLPESARKLAFAGLKRIVDFQDVAYGDDYIDRLQKLTALDAANGGRSEGFRLHHGSGKAARGRDGL